MHLFNPERKCGKLFNRYDTLTNRRYYIVLWVKVKTNQRELSSEDSTHLAGDINRAYSRLIAEWLTYMKNLQTEYPFLFSLACRINPFDPNAKVEIT